MNNYIIKFETVIYKKKKKTRILLVAMPYRLGIVKFYAFDLYMICTLQLKWI